MMGEYEYGQYSYSFIHFGALPIGVNIATILDGITHVANTLAIIGRREHRPLSGRVHLDAPKIFANQS
jgi:hypothetical protein